MYVKTDSGVGTLKAQGLLTLRAFMKMVRITTQTRHLNLFQLFILKQVKNGRREVSAPLKKLVCNLTVDQDERGPHINLCNFDTSF